MVPDIDPPPDYSLIADRKGKRATDDEKLEIYRLKDAGMSLQQLLEITNRSEDSIRRYIREVDAAADAEVRTQAQAYQNMMNPPQRPPREPAYHDDDDDDDDYEAPPSARRPGPPPPPEAPEIELDLDDLFDEDELVDPTEEDALAKKLYVLLLQKKGVKTEDEARDIAQTFRMYPDYHNPHGLVEFLKGHDIKERKASIISRLLFGWQHQSQGQVPFNPGPVPGWSPGMPQPPPGSPGFNQFQQPWGGGYTGYGVPGHQPTLPGQYPFPWPAPPQPSIPQGKSITKDDVEQLVTKAVKERDDWWSKQFDDREAQRVASEKEKQQQQEIAELRAELREMKMNPQTSPPDGNYEAVETPVYDEEGNVVRVSTTYRRLEDPQMVKLQEDYKTLKGDMKEERQALTETLKGLQTALTDAKTEAIRVQLEGQKEVIEAKMDAADKAQKRLDDMNDRLHNAQLEKLELEYANTGELSESMQIANMQKDLFQTALTQTQGARRDLTNTLLIMSGKGKPSNVSEEQWSDEELARMEK